MAITSNRFSPHMAPGSGNPLVNATNKKLRARHHRRGKFAKGLVFVLVMGAFGVLGYLGQKALFQWFGTYPITKIEVNGDLKYAKPEQLQGLIGDFVRGSNYFQISVDSLARKISEMAWIERVDIQKVWPDRLDLFLVELKPVAVWQDKYLLSSQGDLVLGAEAEKIGSLPRLKGSEDQRAWMIDNYQKMASVLYERGLSLGTLELTRYYHWRIEVSDGEHQAEVWVDQDMMLSKLIRFSKMWPSITRLQEFPPKRFDLRYPKGIAVKWKAS